MVNLWKRWTVAVAVVGMLALTACDKGEVLLRGIEANDELEDDDQTQNEVESEHEDALEQEGTSAQKNTLNQDEQETGTGQTEQESSVKTEERHHSLYSADYTVDEVVMYFNEVVLDSEYATGDGDYTAVQKWISPIYYKIDGAYTQEDMAVLTALMDRLNAIDGFPGIYKADTDGVANMFIHFYDYENFNANMGHVVNYEEADGAVEYWYGTETNDIYEMTVGYRTDVDQYIRNSVIQEEIINGLGVTDSLLREDSIVYQGYSDVQEPSEMDWLLIELLYQPEIQCGMNAEQCEAVIRRLYR